jgi:hypothetical protein
MAANQHSNSDDLSLVSGLYGPGNVLCWYFTLASCLISWTLDRKKRRSDSITVDLMVGITLPIVAVAHLITQIHNYPGDTKQMMTTRDPDLLRLIYAIEAPFTITDIFLDDQRPPVPLGVSDDLFQENIHDWNGWLSLLPGRMLCARCCAA